MGLLTAWKEWSLLRKKEMQLRSFAVGMNSSVDIQRDLHIVMLDFDIQDLKAVKESVKEVQFFWRLADAFVYKTKHGFHVFFWFDQVPYERLKLIIDYAKFVDPMYKFISRYHDHKTLRVAGKYQERDIEFLTVLPGVRAPRKHERQIGELKLQEHIALTALKVEVEASKSKAKAKAKQ